MGATTYSYLKCIVYDKLLKPRQSFLITLYFKTKYRFAGLLLNVSNMICFNFKLQHKFGNNK